MARWRSALAGAVLVAAVGWRGAAGGEAARSGLPPGGRTNQFDVYDVTGPSKGEKTCYVWTYAGRPSIIVFTQSVDGRLTGLVKAVDKFVAANKSKRMAGFVVLLDENSEASRQKLADLAKSQKLTLPLTVALEGAKGPPDYKLNSDVPVTVLVSHRNIVRGNFALAGPAPESAEEQKKETDRILLKARSLLGR